MRRTLGWEDVDVALVLGNAPALQGVSLEVGNDADLGALGESRTRSRLAGVSRLDQNFLYIAGEVGIGGAVVLGGNLAGGMHGWSGEIGHAVVDPDGPLCNCGARGCLEQFASKDALLRRAGLPVDYSTEELRTTALNGHVGVPGGPARGGGGRSAARLPRR
jgi:predicted NBD/HSP70 family sugar kinase